MGLFENRPAWKKAYDAAMNSKGQKRLGFARDYIEWLRNATTLEEAESIFAGGSDIFCCSFSTDKLDTETKQSLLPLAVQFCDLYHDLTGYRPITRQMIEKNLAS